MSQTPSKLQLHPPQSSGQLEQPSPNIVSHIPLPQQGPQSLTQLAQVSPLSHLPFPQHTPQSTSQVAQVSPWSQAPLPQQAPQSATHVAQDSPPVASHVASPQQLGQSCAHVW